MTAPLHRLMNILWMFQEKHSNDQWLCDALREGLAEEVLDQWAAYKSSEGSQSSNLEVSFFGKEKKGIGNYSARLAHSERFRWEEQVFELLNRYERYPEKYKEETRRERLLTIIEYKNKNMTDRLPKDLLSEVFFLERKYRTYRKKYFDPMKYWTDPDGNVVNREGEIVIPRSTTPGAEK